TLLSFFRETRASTKSREFICGYKAWIQTIGGDARWRALGKSPSSVACQQESCSRTGELGDAPFSLKVHCKDGQSTIEDLVWQDKRARFISETDVTVWRQAAIMRYVPGAP